MDIKLYRFSPVESPSKLLESLEHIHFSCFKLCHDAFGEYLPIAGNIGFFCHYDAEYELLTKLREEMTEPSDNPKQKYYQLHEPIIFPAKNGVPETTYTHLYIRKPDPYRSQVGDVDFVIGEDEYQELKKSLEGGAIIPGARIFERPDLDMVELHNPDVDVLGYVSPKEMTEKVRIKLN